MTPERSITAYGRRLKQARKHAKLTQGQLAQRSGVKLSTLSELETVAHKSGFTAQLAAACGVNPHWLATGTGNMLDGLSVGVAMEAANYQSTALPSPRETVVHLSEMLRGHSATRQRTIADVLSRFAVDPSNAELAAELVLQISPAEGRKGDSLSNQPTRAANR